jgi:peptidyl-prolyl cis-trans isomerase-like protein 2
VTKEPLKPEDLIKLNYSRKASGEYHDPISFKPFSEHSHIVAIATTGNVYLAESIKGGKDLLDDVKFKKYAHRRAVHGSLTDNFYPREDVITLQNPHGMPPASIPSTSTKTTIQNANDKQMTKPKPAVINTVKEKAAVPCRSYILSWSILSNSDSREHLAVFKWPSRCIFNFHIRRSNREHEHQITLG